MTPLMINCLVFAFALVFTGMWVRRTWFIDAEAKAAADWYGKDRGWSVRESDVLAAKAYIVASGSVFGWLALISWLLLAARTM